MDLQRGIDALNDFSFSTIIPSTNEETVGKPYVFRDVLKLAQIKTSLSKKAQLKLIYNFICEKYPDLTEKQKTNLTVIDIQTLLLKLKINSEDAEIPLLIKCSKCGTSFKAKINICDIGLSLREGFSNLIHLKSKNSKMYMKMKRMSYINYMNSFSDEPVIDMDEPEDGTEINTESPEKKKEAPTIDGKIFESLKVYVDDTVGVIKYSIEGIGIGDSYDTEFDEQQLDSFISSIQKADLKNIEKFILLEPEFTYPNQMICPSCQHSNTIAVNDFFSYCF